MKYIIVTGISGAGKTTVLNTLEDLGYHCIDNMPLHLIPEFTDIMDKNSVGIQKVAIGLDARNAFGFDAFQTAKESIKNTGAESTANQKTPPAYVLKEAFFVGRHSRRQTSYGKCERRDGHSY